MKDQHQGYFFGHTCKVPKENLAQTQHKIDCGRLKQILLNLTTVNLNDERARNLFRSFAALHAEKQRQHDYYPFFIHPYSKLRFFFEAAILFFMCLYLVVLAVKYSMTNPEAPGNLFQLKLYLEAVYFFNMALNFCTGYVDGHTSRYVVLDFKKIVWKNIYTWFPLDFLCCSCSIFKFADLASSVADGLIFGSLRVMSLPIIYVYTLNCLKAKKTGIKAVTTVEISLFLLFFLTWNIYFQFALEYIRANSYSPSNPDHCSWLRTAKLWNASSADRFFFALDRSVGMLRGSANMLPIFITYSECPKHLMNISWLLGQILSIHCTLKYTIALLGSESAKAKYYIMTQQIKAYLDHMKYPNEIKKRILKLYDIRFQSHFFVESRMMDCVSGQLREDIIMYTGRQLVNDVPFLKQLPRSTLNQIGIKLKVVTFIAGDVIYKIHSLGHCMYFVHKGTVAIYGELGRELVHCEDGDFFGESVLALKFRSLPETAIAVTNCELFRLDKEDFDNTVACDPIVYEELKKLSSNKNEKFNVMNEQFKAQLNTNEDKNGKVENSFMV